MLPVLPLIGNCNTGEDNEDLLNAGCRRWLGYTMGALAKRAIRMNRTVGVDVSKLCRASDEEKDCEERNEQNAGWRILRSYFADPSHNYCSLYIMLPELPINERPPGGFRGPSGRGKSATSERRFPPSQDVTDLVESRLLFRELWRRAEVSLRTQILSLMQSCAARICIYENLTTAHIG